MPLEVSILTFTGLSCELHHKRGRVSAQHDATTLSLVLTALIARVVSVTLNREIKMGLTVISDSLMGRNVHNLFVASLYLFGESNMLFDV